MSTSGSLLKRLHEYLYTYDRGMICHEQLMAMKMIGITLFKDLSKNLLFAIVL